MDAKDDKKKQTCLRFMVGDDVYFKRNDMTGWHAGKVEELWYRPVSKKPSCPYRVRQLSSPPIQEGQSPGEMMVEIERDTDSYIRIMLPDQTPKEFVLVSDVKLPEPKDPLDYLYRGSILSSCSNMVNRMANGERSNDTKNVKKGCLTYRDESVETIVAIIAPRIELRRQFCDYGKYSAEELFDSIFPKESSIDLLQKVLCRIESELASSTTPDHDHLHQERCQKLLNLGDALLFLHGQLRGKRNFKLAMVCYDAAAFDVTEKEMMERHGFAIGIQGASASRNYGFPVGSPEALCASATQLHFTTEAFCFQIINGLDLMSPSPIGVAILERPMLDVEQILTVAAMDSRIRDNINVIISHLTAALRHHGWFSMLAFLYGKALNKVDQSTLDIWPDPISQNNIRKLKTSHHNHQIKLQIQEEKMSNTFITHYGLPRQQTVSAFSPKAIKILRSMPIHFQPVKISALTTLTLQISFFELPTPSSPVCVLIFCSSPPAAEFLRIPDELQLFPFSQETFQWIWDRVAYLLHLGFPSSINDNSLQNPYQCRLKPKVFRIKNVGGDLQFANFLQLKCFQIPGTSVELVKVDEDSYDTMGFHDNDRELWPLSAIQAGINQLTEEETVRQMTHAFSRLKPKSQSMISMVRQLPEAENCGMAVTDDDISKVLTMVKKQKSLGNISFQDKRYHRALKYYATGISNLRKIRDASTKEIFEVLGALLSNYAACGLELAKKQDPMNGLMRLKEVVGFCDIALKNSAIINSSSVTVVKKLHFRRNLALARQPANDPTIRVEEIRGDYLGYIVHTKFNLQIFNNESNKKESITILKGKEVKKTEEFCYVCYEEYASNLGEKIVLELPCNHFICAKCFMTKNKKSRTPGEVATDCGVCRATVKESLWNKTLDEHVKELSSSREELKRLCLPTEEERLEFFRSLLIAHGLDLDMTVRALDEMLYMNACGNLWQTNDFTWIDKDAIYKDAMRPVMRLEEDIKVMKQKLDNIVDVQGDDYKCTENLLLKYQQKLNHAKVNANDDIFHRINATGSMGRENKDGEIQLDFHSLTVKGAKDKLDTIVVPILPIVRSLILILGQGRHSPDHIGILKKSITKYIAQKYKRTVRWETIKKNNGAIRLCYKEDDGAQD